jgi:hypothetical protein
MRARSMHSVVMSSVGQGRSDLSKFVDYINSDVSSDMQGAGLK